MAVEAVVCTVVVVAK